MVSGKGRGGDCHSLRAALQRCRTCAPSLDAGEGHVECSQVRAGVAQCPGQCPRAPAAQLVHAQVQHRQAPAGHTGELRPMR